MPSTDNHEDDADALAEGRRIYLGNLLYAVKPSEIEQALTEQGFDDYEQIHISVDPISGRNPGYCFVDFRERTSAENALTYLSATIRSRPVKVGPCLPKQQRPARWGRDSQDRPTSFQRWGDWKRPDANGGVPATQLNSQRPEQGPAAALDHFYGIFERGEGKRLYIGGLGKMADQAEGHVEMTEILAGLNPSFIGKRITAQDNTRSKPGNHNYCFVDFETEKEARKALDTLNGKHYKGGSLKVSYARGHPESSKQRGAGMGARHTPRVTVKNASFTKSQSSEESKRKAMKSSEWRKRD